MRQEGGKEEKRGKEIRQEGRSKRKGVFEDEGEKRKRI